MTRAKLGTIDLAALRAALGRARRGDLLVMLGRAVERLSPDALEDVLADYYAVKDFRLTSATPRGLLAEVKAFCARAQGGEYYTSFRVDSRNFMEKSEGTEAFMAELDRLYACCIRAAESRPDRATREAFERLFALEAAVDEDPDAIVFFADEAGAWQLLTVWAKVLPAWFRCLAATAGPEEFAREVHRVIRAHCEHNRAKLLPKARSVASAAQKRALVAAPTTEGT
ncbi:MAG: hypothetical protein HY909_31335 [Deltaproteobacteria bacterium]|nr:hypothetical protein [Deltaproteobacteria bacterium]